MGARGSVASVAKGKNVKTFPVLWQCTPRERTELRKAECPVSVPWDLVAPHQLQASKNHSQSIARLAERGGLSPSELVAVIDGHGYDWIRSTTSLAQVPRLLELVRRHTGDS
jgi:hypothetical protein